MSWKNILRALCSSGFILGVNSGCAVLYKVQLSDLNSSSAGEPVSIMVSENTVDFQQVGQAMGALGRASKSKGLQKTGSTVEDVAALFQWGPRTGTPVFNDIYASMVGEELFAKCKGGHLANIVSIREARTYPIISGQIIRIDATCFKHL